MLTTCLGWFLVELLSHAAQALGDVGEVSQVELIVELYSTAAKCSQRPWLASKISMPVLTEAPSGWNSRQVKLLSTTARPTMATLTNAASPPPGQEVVHDQAVQLDGCIHQLVAQASNFLLKAAGQVPVDHLGVHGPGKEDQERGHLLTMPSTSFEGIKSQLSSRCCIVCTAQLGSQHMPALELLSNGNLV